MRAIWLGLVLGGCALEEPPTVAVTPRIAEATPEQTEAYLARRRAEKEAEREARRRALWAELDHKIDLNGAARDALLQLDDVDDDMAARILAGRPWDSVVALEGGLGPLDHPDQVKRILDQAYVPIRFDTCDKATLMQIETLTDEGADALIAGRPYRTRDAFLDALAPRVDPEVFPRISRWIAGP